LLSLYYFCSIKIASIILQDDDDSDDFKDSDNDEEENNDNGSGGDKAYDEVEEEEDENGVVYFSDLYLSIHPTPLFVGTTIGALSFLPNPSINIIALGLSNGIIKMYAIRILSNYKIVVVISILNINTFYYTCRYT